MEEKKNNKVVVIAIGVILVVVFSIGGYFLGKKVAEKENEAGSNITSNKEEKKLPTKEEVEALIDKNYYYDTLYNDIVNETKITDKIRLLVAIGKYDSYLNSLDEKQFEQQRKQMGASKIFKNDSNIIDSDDYLYKVKGTNIESSASEDDELIYYPYNIVNKYYKEIYNAEAPKMNIEYKKYLNYYYSSKLDAYVFMGMATGTQTPYEAIYMLKDFKVENNKLIASIYHVKYESEIFVDETDKDDEFKYIYRIDKKTEYEISVQKKDEDIKKLKSDMLKNHVDKMNVYDFVFDINGDNYYLQEINKIK